MIIFEKEFGQVSITTTPTLWAGTNSGAIYVYTLTIPSGDKRASDAVTCHLGTSTA
ncbi:LLGL1, partial [Cordylochernes scorpioides]